MLGAAPPSFTPTGAEWIEVKLKEIARGAEEEGAGADMVLALIEFCSDSGQIHLGSSVHLNPDITPEYKTSQAWQAASRVAEIRWSSLRWGSGLFI